VRVPGCVRDATVAVGLGIAWVEPDGRVEIGGGFLPCPHERSLTGVREAPAEEGIGVVRIEPDGRVEVGDGSVVISPVVVRDAAAIEGAGIGRVGRVVAPALGHLHAPTIRQLYLPHRNRQQARQLRA
jgi:hypothetical protein